MVVATYQKELARLGEEPGAPNIDCWSVDPDDIMKLGDCLNVQARHAGRIMFPSRPTGYVMVTHSLASYAYSKAAAMRCRVRGSMVQAQTYEGICERIYTRLPDWAKW